MAALGKTFVVVTTASRGRVLEDVDSERDRQDEKFPDQHHTADGTSALRYGSDAEIQRELCDRASRAGKCTWKHILLEEVYEAMAEEDPAKLREELVQVAAVCVRWCEEIDSRGK